MREGAAICLTARYRWPESFGLNPAKLGKIDNYKQEPWKLPLPRFVERLYFERLPRSAVLTAQLQGAVT
jgi:hypothetical protein